MKIKIMLVRDYVTNFRIEFFSEKSYNVNFDNAPLQKKKRPLSDFLVSTQLNHLAITVRTIVPIFRKTER